MKRTLIKGLPAICLVAAAVVALPASAVTPGAGATGGAEASDPAYDTTHNAATGQPSSQNSDRYSTSSPSGQMSDSAITAKVKSALVAARDIPSTQIKVETNAGVVQLSGFLNSQNEIDRAVSVARSVPDVRGVENNMQMR